MARNLRFFRNDNDIPCARGPVAEKILTVFLETDIQEDTIILQALLDDLWAVQNGHADAREFYGNAHTVTMTPETVTIQSEADETGPVYSTKLKHFHEVLLDWEAFI
ncbi:MAG TPA: hypothetical protein DD979_00370 [Gammaproteobacteria bacterium]|jgi:hypothetical protein|nr:hypothetical protein [Gammaproteobacteria bacterium]